MDRVEQIWKAQESAYNKMMEDDDQYCHPESFRWGFEQGVEWAEKDLALAWQDVAILITIYEQGVDNGDYRRYNDAEWMKEYSQDILRRFNEIRKK